MKRLLLLVLLLSLFLFLPLEGSAANTETLVADVKWVQTEDFENPLLRLNLTDRNIYTKYYTFHEKTYYCYMTYRPADAPEDSATTIFTPIVKSDSRYTYLDPFSYGFAPDGSKEYIITFFFEGFAGDAIYDYNTRKVTLSANSIPEAVSRQAAALPIDIRPYYHGFLNRLDRSYNYATQLSFFVKYHNSVFTQPRDTEWVISVQGKNVNATFSLSPNLKDPDAGLFFFTPCQSGDFVPELGESYQVTVMVYQDNRMLFCSKPTEFLCMCKPMKVPTERIYASFDITPLQKGFYEETDAEGKLFTALRVGVMGLPAMDPEKMQQYDAWYVTYRQKGEKTENTVRVSLLSYQNSTLTFSGMLPMRNTEYVIQLWAKNGDGIRSFESGFTDGFICENIPKPGGPSSGRLLAVTPTPKERTFDSLAGVRTGILGVAADPALAWELCFAKVNDPSVTLVFSAVPDSIEDGTYVFAIPEDVPIPFATGDALTLTVQAYSKQYNTVYQSEPTPGYYFDLLGIPPIGQGGEIIPTSPQGGNGGIPSASSPLWFLAPICLAALGTAAFFALKGKKK